MYKRLFWLSMVLLILILIAACGESDGQVSTGDNNTEQPSKSDEGSSASGDVVEIDIGHVGAPVSPQQGAAEIFKKLVEEKTNESVKINIFNSSQLGDEREIVESVQMSIVDGGIISAGLFGSSYPVMGAFEVPFLFEDREHALKVNTGEIGRELLDELESRAGLKALSIWDHGFRQLTNNERSIKEPSDLEGLQIRSPEVPSYSVALEVLGATPVPMAFSELYVALDRGVVNGQHNPLMHIEGQNFFEVQDYMTVMDFAYTPNILTFSQGVWEELTTDQQQQIMEAATETAEQWSVEAAKENDELMKELQGKMEVLTSEDVNRQEFADIVTEKGYPQYREEFSDEFVEFLEKVQAAAE